MSEEIDIEEHNVLEDPALRDIFSDIDLIKEELRNYEQDIEVHGCSVVASAGTNQDATQIKSANIPGVIKVEHNSLSFDIEILEEDEVFIGDDEKPDPVDLKNEINVLQTTADKFEEFFKEQVDQEKWLNVNVVLDNLEQYLLSSDRFCSYCLTLFATKNALDVHMYSRHPTFGQNKYKHVNQRKNKNCKYEPKTIICKKKLKTCFNNLNLHSNIIKPQSQSHLQKQIFNDINFNNQKNLNIDSKNACSLQQASMSHKHKNLQKSIENKLCCTNSNHYSVNTTAEKNKSIPAFKKSVVVLNKLQIPGKSVKLTQGRLKIRKLTKKSRLKTLNTEIAQVRTCLKKANPFATARLMSFHIANSHDITENTLDEGDVSIFDPKCEFCIRHFQDPLSYNKHLWRSHSKYVKNKYLIERTPKPCSQLDARRNKTIDNDCRTFLEKSDLSSQVVASSPSYFVENDMDLDIVQFEAGEVKRKLEELTKSELNTITPLAEDKTCEKICENQTNTKIYILKSAYFKCLKCDIYFLCSNIATNHKDHLEMLINWKCAICKLIFKKEDEIMHELQHVFTENFTVYGVLPGDQIRILYNCQKCTVNFNGDHFLKHYPTCENITPHPKYCRVCDILVDDFISKAHEQSHFKNKLTPDDFIIVESDVIPVLTGNQTISKKPSSRFNDISSESLKAYYCKICNCYSHTQKITQIHIQGRCANLAKSYCQYCGLSFVSCCSYSCVCDVEGSSLQHHKQIHKMWVSLSLNHFDFYDIENNPITPPIPNYMECKGCNIHFISKNWYRRHKCEQGDIRTCSLCETNYEKRTFELHMQFHNYFKIDISIDSSINSNRANKNITDELSGRTNTSESNVVEPEQLPFANTSDTTTLNVIKRQNTEGHSIETNVVALSAKTSLKDKQSQKRNLGDLEVPRKRKTLKIEKPLVLPDRFDIYYCSACEACRHRLTTTTTKTHSLQLCLHMKLINCESCGLKFTKNCYELHKLMHKRVRDLDINYFTFYDHEGIPIAPPLPKYFECQKCHIHFFERQSITQHDCGKTDYQKCGSCEIKYDNQTIKFHMSIHNYSKRDIQSDNLIVSKNTPVMNGSIEMSNTKENEKLYALKPAKRSTK